MKRFCLVLAILLVLSFTLSIFSACGNKDVFVKYSFNNKVGELVSDKGSYVDLDIENSVFINSDKLDYKKTDCIIDKNKIILNDGTLIYYSDYYMAFSDKLFGYIEILPTPQDEISEEQKIQKFDGDGFIGNEKVTFSDGVITAKEEQVGVYTLYNNYISINYGGYNREYLTLAISIDENEVKTVGFFDEFYSKIKVVGKKIEYTGFTVDTNVLTNFENAKIEIMPLTDNYTIKETRFEVVDNGGFVLYLNADGVYDIKLKSELPSNRISVKIIADGLTRIIDFMPIVVNYDKNVMIMRFVGDSVDLNSGLWYSCRNIDFNDVEISNEIVDGRDCGSIENGVLNFTKSGYVIIKLTATYNIDDKEYTVTDKVSINISERQSEAENAVEN